MTLARKIAASAVLLQAALAGGLLLMDRGNREPVGVGAQAASPQHDRADLLMPVIGSTRRDLADTWNDARSEGRAHQGIDIMAPAGVAVIAAVDGRVVRFFDSRRGGVTIYQFDAAERFVYYYAHLRRRAPGLAEGDFVRQGQVIGYVGDTGNADVPHLHFEIQRLGRERKWWRAHAVNPYPHLMAGRPPR